MVAAPRSDRHVRSGFSIIELIVAIAVISILLALILPAVLSAREGARRIQCHDNLKQLALAASVHETAYGFFPSNGWGWLWYGEPGRGIGRKQPGGWIWSILPQLDKQTIWDKGVNASLAMRPEVLAELAQTPLPFLVCPTRRGAILSLQNTSFEPWNATWLPEVFTTDYAINEGDWISGTGPGPETLAIGDTATYPWKDMSSATGVSFLRSEVRTQMIRDGLSNTYLIGEKFVSCSMDETGFDPGNDQSALTGVDLDITRWTTDVPIKDSALLDARRFGSAHNGACGIAFCDGSVKSINYSIDREVHRRLGTRAEGLPVTVP